MSAIAGAYTSMALIDRPRDDAANAGMAIGKAKVAAVAIAKPAPAAIAAAAFSGLHPVEIHGKVEGCGKIVHVQSSGSEHEPSSVCLAAMVDEFMEAEQSKCRKRESPSSSKDDDHWGGEVLDYLKGFVACSSDRERELASAAARALSLVQRKASSELCKDGMDCASGCVKRATLRHLRAEGYNAAICKSRWDHAGGFPGGDYEYIDVLIEAEDGGSKLERMIVDIDFRGQFEIARPTERYSATFQELPAMFVGCPERLQQIVNLMCDGMKRSLKKRGMPLPPWRKPDYMRAKWFSAYKRTTNEALRPHESTDAVVRRELFHTAFRGANSNWQSRFTNGVELQMAERTENAAASIHTAAPAPAAIDTASAVQQQTIGKKLPIQAQEPGTRSSQRVLRGGDEITAVATDWKPPAVSRPRRMRPAAGVTGLASVLIEAGLSTLANEQQRRQQRQPESSRKPCMVAVS